jgi:lysophospholipase L1-like esterase
VVIGDSISSTGTYDRYRRGVAGEDSRRPVVWWARLVKDAGLGVDGVLPLTEGGSGYLRRGDRTSAGSLRACAGTTFAQRLKQVAAARPRVVIVAGGRNDTRVCSGRRKRPASMLQQRRAVIRFFDRLGATVSGAGMPRARVFVLAPWGTSDVEGRADLVRVIERAARTAGFSYVPVPHLRGHELQDTIHPDAAGTARLARAVAEGSTITAALAAISSEARPGTPPVTVRGSRACTTAERRDAASSWGRAGAAGMVNARLVRSGRSPVRVARGQSWFDRARAAGARVVAAPAAGDVAWWPNGPRAALGTGEHVAIVRGVLDGGLDVRVTESGRMRTCQETAYGAAGLPRAFLRMPRSSGSPTGRVGTVATGRRLVSVAGWTMDPDAATGHVHVRVTVRAGSTVVARRVVRDRFDRFAVRLVVPAKHATPGRRLQVLVEALNRAGTRGRPVVRLGTRTVHLPR